MELTLFRATRGLYTHLYTHLHQHVDLSVCVCVSGSVCVIACEYVYVSVYVWLGAYALARQCGVYTHFSTNIILGARVRSLSHISLAFFRSHRRTLWIYKCTHTQTSFISHTHSISLTHLYAARTFISFLLSLCVRARTRALCLSHAHMHARALIHTPNTRPHTLSRTHISTRKRQYANWIHSITHRRSHTSKHFCITSLSCARTHHHTHACMLTYLDTFNYISRCVVTIHPRSTLLGEYMYTSIRTQIHKYIQSLKARHP